MNASSANSINARPSFSPPFGLAGGRRRALVGGLIWLAVVLFALPSPLAIAWGYALLLLSPLVLLPFGLELTSEDSASGWAHRLEQAVAVLQLPAALLLGGAYLLPQGVWAASLAFPWLATTALIALRGLLRIWRRGLQPLTELCLDAGLIYLSIGGAWALADRMGFRPLDFAPVIVLLTAIHFHYAGFVMPLVTGLAARELKGWIAIVAVIGVIAGVPLVAVGISASQMGWNPLLEAAAAWFMAASGTLVAWLHLRLASQSLWPRKVRALWILSGLSLCAGMLLAALYGARFYLPLEWLDIPWMRALHGTVNALGFGVGSLLAWSLAQRYRRKVRT